MKEGKKKLFTKLAIIILLVGGSLIAFVSIFVKQARDQIARDAIMIESDKAFEEFTSFFIPADKALSIIKNWGLSGILESSDHQKMAKQIIPVLQELNLFESASIAGQNIQDFFIYKNQEGHWVYRVHGSNDNLFESFKLDNSLTVIGTWVDTLDYDVTSRPWYKLGIESLNDSTEEWTESYRFNSTGVLGVSGVTSWIMDKDTMIAAIDLPMEQLLIDISETVNSETRTFVLSEIRGNKIFDSGSSDFVEDHPEEVYELALSQFTSDDEEQLIAFRYNGQSWHGVFRLADESRRLWFVTLAKEDSLLGTITERAAPIGLVSGVIILLGIFGTWRVIRNTRDTGLQIAAHDTDQLIEQALKQGEGPQVEYKSTIRMNLHTKKPGKEIELAWLKGVSAFLNTDGGTLLIGVNDDGEVIGLEPDAFPNEDKAMLHIKNLIRQHIGTDFFEYIHYNISERNGMWVAALVVSPANHPAYLLDKNGEEVFYVRSGPSSEKLPVSKLVDYLSRRSGKSN